MDNFVVVASSEETAAADAAGMTVEQYKKFLELKRESDAIQEEQRKEKEAEARAAADALASILRQRRFYKRCLLAALALCALLFSLLYKAQRERYISENLANGTLPVRVSMEAECVSYSGLGTDVSFSYFHNARKIISGDILRVGKNFTVTALVVEYDAGTSDIAEGDMKISLPPLSGEKSTRITVREAGGGGHTGSATYKISCAYKAAMNPLDVLMGCVAPLAAFVALAAAVFICLGAKDSGGFRKLWERTGGIAVFFSACAATVWLVYTGYMVYALAVLFVATLSPLVYMPLTEKKIIKSKKIRGVVSFFLTALATVLFVAVVVGLSYIA